LGETPRRQWPDTGGRMPDKHRRRSHQFIFEAIDDFQSAAV